MSQTGGSGATRIDYSELRATLDEVRGADGPDGGGPDRAGGAGVGRALGSLVRRLLGWVVVAAALLVLPFAVLVRTAVGAQQGLGAGAWVAVLAGLLATGGILVLYAVVAGRWLGVGPGFRRTLRWGSVGAGAAFVVWALLWLGAAQAKSPEVRAEYHRLHPVLRLATSTVFLVDPWRVMTDAAREPEDYALMGLPPAESSLHFVQEDGFVHAVDLRTRGRPEWVNKAVELGFWALGFHALRHRGTADHLHVSLRTR